MEVDIDVFSLSMVLLVVHHESDLWLIVWEQA